MFERTELKLCPYENLDRVYPLPQRIHQVEGLGPFYRRSILSAMRDGAEAEDVLRS